MAAIAPAAWSAAPATAAELDRIAITFASGGLRLSGELLVPSGRGPHPALVMLHGAGPDTREGYRPVATALARAGVAAFIFDKRGSGRSQGDPDYRYAELAGDARAAVGAVRARPEVSGRGVGLWGLSEGGFIAPLAAAGNAQVAAVAVVSPSALAPVVQQEWAVRNGVRASGSGALGTRSVTTFYRVTRSLGEGSLAGLGPRRARDVAFAPAAAWRRVAQPVLAVWGTGDDLVPVRGSARALRASLESGRNRSRTFLTFAGAEHDLTTGARAGRPIYAAGYPQAAATWLREQVAGPRPRARVSTPLPPAGGEVAPAAVEPAWSDAAPVQLAWLGLPLAILLGVGATAVAARGRGRPRRRAPRLLRGGVGAAAFGVVATMAGLASVIAVDGQGVAVVSGYPVALLPGLLAAGAGGTAVLGGLASARVRGAPGALRRDALVGAAGLAWVAWVLCWLL